MTISKVNRIYSWTLMEKLKKDYLKADVIDYNVRRFLEDLCEEGLYERHYPRNKPKWRITFPFFLLTILIVNIIGAIKWLFVGSARFDEKQPVIKWVIAWDKFCRFNIV
jgi:hypothetical protein